MDRKDFLKLCGLSGLTVFVGTRLTEERDAIAEPAPTLFLNIHFGGGIDTTNFVDPKGAETVAEAEAASPSTVMNRYLRNEIPSDAATGITWAPLHLSRQLNGPNPNQGAIDNATRFHDFMVDNAKDLLVIRGVDHQTNSHDVGARLAVTGTATEHSAAFGALAAGALLPSAAMGFVSFGGYSETNGAATVTRLGNLDAVKRLAYPLRRNPDDETSVYLDDVQAAALAEARKGRFEAKLEKASLPRIRGAMNTLYLSRLGQNQLKQLVGFLPETLLGGSAGAVQLIGAAYKAGLCVAASLSAPSGYDHHNNIDANLANALGAAFDPDVGIPGMLRVLEEFEIRDRTCMTWTSDFGRTPGYNDSNGKDHWAISSVVATGYVNGKRIAPGVKGLTSDRHEAVPVDLQFAKTADPSGQTIKAGHVQNALRRVAGFLESDLSRANPSGEAHEEFPDLIELGS